jgi:L-fuconolactonase
LDFPLTDTHVHFWDQRRLAYAWLARVPEIASVHTPTELAVAAGARPASRLVFVECDGDRARFLDEVAWVEELAAREPRIQAVVAFAPVDRGRQTLASLGALRARPIVRGVRHLIQGQRDPGFCLRREFLEGVRACGERGLSFDICVKHHQLGSVVEMVRACPHTSFILDHAGKPDIRNRLLDPWRAHVAALARLPNVVCKFSGLVTEADPAAWTVDDLRPYADHLLATFGPGRLMFGSDWPVVDLAASYGRWLDAALELLAPLSPDERQAVLSDNAGRVYRLP